MSISGFVLNNTGRAKFIFKRSVYFGAKISLSDLYSLYSKDYGGEFDTNFLEWLEKNKMIPGFEIIIGDIEISSAPEEKSPERLEEERELFVKQVPPNKLTARDISELKIKDDPKRIIRTINSKTKLRRALTLCKGRAGKETLLKYIHERISELL